MSGRSGACLARSESEDSPRPVPLGARLGELLPRPPFAKPVSLPRRRRLPVKESGLFLGLGSALCHWAFRLSLGQLMSCGMCIKKEMLDSGVAFRGSLLKPVCGHGQLTQPPNLGLCLKWADALPALLPRPSNETTAQAEGRPGDSTAAVGPWALLGPWLQSA